MAIVFMSDKSRYQFRPLLTEDANEIYRLQAFRGIRIRDFSDNVTIRRQSADRLDLLSFELYGTTRFDWVLAVFNNLKFPIADLEEKEVLIAPSKETLLTVIIPGLSLQLEAFL